VARKRSCRIQGRIVVAEHTSAVLTDNPLGDPHVRQLPVWLPPQYDDRQRGDPGGRFPVLFVLSGYGGSGLGQLNWRPFEESVPERAARLVHAGAMPPCIIVFPDCFTALGGSQYLNSSALGRYAEYLTEELIPFVDREFRTLASRNHRGISGKSSGGYGAMMHGMLFPHRWGAVGNHSGDAYFAMNNLCLWPAALNELSRFRSTLRHPGPVDMRVEGHGMEHGIDDGRVERFLEHVWSHDKLTDAELHCLMLLCSSAAYDPDPTAPLGFRLPVNLETGEILPERWDNWLNLDPIALVNRHAEALRSLRGLWIDCGWRDQYHLHYGTRILSQRLWLNGIQHVYEEFDDDHTGVDYRMERSLPYLAQAIA
jgi:S-formylglutathione hydrolase FrmB